MLQPSTSSRFDSLTPTPVKALLDGPLCARVTRYLWFEVLVRLLNRCVPCHSHGVRNVSEL
jgi:hypothetical protein